MGEIEKVEKQVARANLVWTVGERLWKAAQAFGLQPLIAAIVLGVAGALALWAGRVSPLIQEAAPASYVVFGLIVLICVSALLRTWFGRRQNQVRIPRVAAWFEASDAELEFADNQLRAEHDAAERESRRLKDELRELSSQLPPGQMLSKRKFKEEPAPEPPEVRDLRKEVSIRQTAIARLQTSKSELRERMRSELRKHLKAGKLIARGFEETLREHGQKQVLILPEHWRMLQLDEYGRASGGEMYYCGVEIGRPQSRFAGACVALFGPKP